MTEADRQGQPSSNRTILVACAANLAIAIAKGVAALFTGSAALWAETLHSVADTGNELLMWLGLRQSRRRPDPAHPFGHGQERFFWAFLAALGIFLIGGLLSIGEGIRSLLNPEPLDDPWVGIAVLVLSAGFEGYSWHTARRQLQGDARRRRRSLPEQIARTSDPSATTVYLEDSAALVGIGLALAGVALHMLTGWPGWDAAASIAIGLLLTAVAVLLARRSKGLLVNESAPPDVLDRLQTIIGAPPWMRRMTELRAIFVGPSALLVLLTVEPVASLRTEPAERLLKDVDALRERLQGSPAVLEVAVTLIGPDDARDR
ncbi:cation diffusion facilitator family transporter [Dactylosporangium aurantiacum]|uniref:Cation diffusion facilitator family transporter n=1 Tax=Dactylosporangium aurantiacum TaxID=35754 RepID=A0A9Q9MGT7_9ACTN|nr:cation diffusion facilitator family transporter [Dactylosporangium aurantiacum]MDG6110501.1 cation diffusion facilitator family transporter [Dactylosporangium aurantiacum]UWZ58643.1 cation diffusion facilitator family transporter [Dactylosporangium aurantiacum]